MSGKISKLSCEAANIPLEEIFHHGIASGVCRSSESQKHKTCQLPSRPENEDYGHIFERVGGDNVNLTMYGSRSSNPSTTSATFPAPISPEEKGVREEQNNPEEPARLRRTVRVWDEKGGDGGAPAGNPGGDLAVGELEDLGLCRH